MVNRKVNVPTLVASNMKSMVMLADGSQQDHTKMKVVISLGTVCVRLS
jgi:hypothetical protein